MKAIIGLFLATVLAFSCSYTSTNQEAQERQKERDSLISVIDLQIDTLNEALGEVDKAILTLDSAFADLQNKGDWYRTKMGQLTGAKSAAIEERNRLELQRVILMGD